MNDPTLNTMTTQWKGVSLEDFVVVDFETYYDKDYSLRKMKTVEYVEDERFEVLGCGFASFRGDEIETQFSTDPDAIRATVEGAVSAGKIITAFNGFFDFSILYRHYGITPERLADIQFIANHVLGSSQTSGKQNSLAALADRLGHEAKGDLAFMRGVRDPSPAELVMLREYAEADARIEACLLEELLPQLSRPDYELWLMDHTFRLFLERPLRLEEDLLHQVRSQVDQRKADAVACAEVGPDIILSNDKFQKELADRLEAVGLEVPMKQGKRGMIPALAKSDPPFIAMRRSKHQPVRDLVLARLEYKSMNTVHRRVEEMLRRHRLGGLSPQYRYYGAHTGRWQGAGGFNLNNLTQPDRCETKEDAEVARYVRQAIRPHREGDVFVMADASQVEARTNGWAAGAESFLEPFREGRDIYCEFISDVLGETIRKPTPDDDAETTEYLTVRRHIGKAAILGLGFNMGAMKFMEALKREPRLTDLVGKGKLVDRDFAASLVYGYRDKYAEIPQYWRDLSDAFMLAVDGREQALGETADGRDLLLFSPIPGQRGRGVALTLPSGRTLFYRDLRWESKPGGTEYIARDGTVKETKGGKKELKHGNGQRIYGGLLAENVAQAIARDILAGVILGAESRGYPVALHTYDDCTCSVPAERAEECMQALTDLFSTTPSWADDRLPLASEAHIAEDLTK